MPTFADVRKIALALPGVIERDDKRAFLVVDDARKSAKPKLVAWMWNERVDPKKARVPNPKVLVVRAASIEEKHLLIEAAPAVYFTEPHYDGYNAVLVRLDVVARAELAKLIEASWRRAAPKRLVINR
jgi:hypothetical protein